MTTKMKLGLFMVPLLLLSVCVSSASASCCYFYRGYGSGWTPPGLYHERPPYFSYFPPVYYGMGYASGYRASASAVSRQPSRPVTPLRIRNPFVVTEAEAVVTGRGLTGQPQRITNPYAAARNPSGLLDLR